MSLRYVESLTCGHFSNASNYPVPHGFLSPWFFPKMAQKSPRIFITFSDTY